MHNVRR